MAEIKTGWLTKEGNNFAPATVASQIYLSDGKPLSSKLDKTLTIDSTEVTSFEDPQLLHKTDVINNVTSTNTDKPLSAAQGKQLKSEIDTLNSSLMYIKGVPQIVGKYIDGNVVRNIKRYIIDIPSITNDNYADFSIDSIYDDIYLLTNIYGSYSTLISKFPTNYFNNDTNQNILTIITGRMIRIVNRVNADIINGLVYIEYISNT